MAPSSPHADEPLIDLDLVAYEQARMLRPQVTNGVLTLGPRRLDLASTLVCPACAPVRVAAVAAWAERYADLSAASNPAPLAALLFDATGDPWPLVHFFPTLGVLPRAAQAQRFAQIGALAARAELDLRLLGERRRDRTEELPASARWIVAGHVVEVLGDRAELLAGVLRRPRHIRLYTSAAAFSDDGGVAGGDYDPRHERIQLGLSRLFEGFYEPTPGVAPLLHEFGHMLDACDPISGRMTRGHGLLPGLDPRDGPLFVPEARRHFLAGKRLERQRYEALRVGPVPRDPAVDLPVGHPYVFQNDGEFIAGYLELFLRTPNRFASLNPELYAGFTTLLGQDPRAAWPQDFAWYANENEAVYLRGEALSPAGISVPTS